eukprot:CAMPEP_0180236786 /NCGR_PEP_ID=MMETSP0987-20121128/29977_1 /TAXON_ID=697907 /ORGANISM="non described non described, Strain CCMP2293" /LENGTH=60 /DNA_ID=CAMNT_0022203059 /DNA_START=219 /DNA_END=398 /DNA_ORIENTATION=-
MDGWRVSSPSPELEYNVGGNGEPSHAASLQAARQEWQVRVAQQSQGGSPAKTWVGEKRSG